MASADALSRLPLPDLPAIESSSGEMIKAWTEKDPLLSRVHQVLHGWTVTNSDGNLLPYFNRCDELSITDGCVLWGSRVIIPPSGPDIIFEATT